MIKKQNKVGRPILMPHPWGELAEAVGGTFALAEKLGVKQPTIHRWAHGKSRIPLMTIKEIKRLCGMYKIQNLDGLYTPKQNKVLEAAKTT